MVVYCRYKIAVVSAGVALASQFLTTPPKARFAPAPATGAGGDAGSGAGSGTASATPCASDVQALLATSRFLPGVHARTPPRQGMLVAWAYSRSIPSEHTCT